MTPYFEDGPVMVYQGHVLDVLRQMPDESVNCVVTSPPYWGLRDYGTAEWQGGSEDCDHLKPAAHGYNPIKTSTLGPNRDGISTDNSAHANEAKRQQYTCACGKCGATRIDHQIGLEKTPQEYIAKMVEVFREVRRVLTDEGALWVNIGDSYASGKGTCYNPGGGETSLGKDRKDEGVHPLDRGNKSTLAAVGLKPKDLVGIPWMLAFALRADGWYLRQEIIWEKPNPMPESVTDRCTKAHEQIFLLTKNSRYYFDQEAILEDVSPGTHARLSQNVEAQIGSERANGGQKTNGNMKAVGRKLAEAGSGTKNNTSFDAAMAVMPDKRNKRSVWTVATEAFSEAHFATFPQELIKPCILAGCPAGGVVLDPFAGSLTTMQVASKLNCKSIGIELNSDYIDIGIRCRLKQSVLDFTQEETCPPTHNS
jgi:DNA modification methylase